MRPRAATITSTSSSRRRLDVRHVHDRQRGHRAALLGVRRAWSRRARVRVEAKKDDDGVQPSPKKPANNGGAGPSDRRGRRGRRRNRIASGRV